MTDAIFMAYPLSGIPNITAIWNENGGCVTGSDISMYVWFAASDFIIGGYCLFAFIFPLRKQIKLEQKSISESEPGSESGTFSTIAKRITLWSTIMLISTMICTITAAIYNPSSGIYLFVFVEIDDNDEHLHMRISIMNVTPFYCAYP